MGGISAEGQLEKPDGVAEAMRLSKDQSNQRTDVANGGSAEQTRDAVLFSPGFRSAAANAGWDAEALLMAAMSRSPMDASQVAHVDARKRDKHTPLSASAPRHRRVRLEDKTGSPLGRLPMKPLTLLSDSELENIAPAYENCRIFVAEGKENCSHNSLPCKKGDNDLKGKAKEQTPTKPLCLDQLREELSCAVCLEICFEPSTISCGHSFCGTCLQSVLQKCGPRCPKCRQPLRSEAVRNYRINTVLWNTIQILFPKESAARIQDKQQQSRAEEEEAAKRRVLTEEHQSGRYLGTRPSRMQPWRTTAFNNVSSRSNVMGNLRTSFQAASELMMLSSRERDVVDHHGSRPELHNNDTRNWISSENMERPGRSHTGHSRQTQAQATQEQVDAALAARLQQAELNAAGDGEDLLILEEPRERSDVPLHPTVRRSPRTGTSAAAVTFQTVAQRATRQRRVRIRSRSQLG